MADVWTHTEENSVKEIHELGAYDKTRMINHVKMDKGVEEKFATLTGATGTVTHDCTLGNVFYHTGCTANFTANFTNINLTQEYSKDIVVIVNQGSTAYMPTAVQIGGNAQSIHWNGNSAPTGTADGVDIVTFTILNDGGTYVVIGKSTPHGAAV